MRPKLGNKRNTKNNNIVNNNINIENYVDKVPVSTCKIKRKITTRKEHYT